MDRSAWKMDKESLRHHLLMENRARRIPDKKKQQAKQACRKKFQ